MEYFFRATQSVGLFCTYKLMIIYLHSKEESTSWLSIRYLDENIDPIQLALNEEESDTPELKQQKYENAKAFQKRGPI